MKFRKNALLAFTGAVTMALVACGGSKSGGFTVCIASEPDTIDPALNSAVDGATMLVHLGSGLMRYHQENGKLVLKYDLAKSITKASAAVVDHAQAADESWSEVNYPEGVRYTIELRDDIKFSDGSPITADDFIYSWNRASGSTVGADYGFLFEVIADGVYHETDDSACPSLGINKVSDTVFTVDLPAECAYMDQLFAFPTFYPVKKAVVEQYDTTDNGIWATSPKSYVGAGPYKLTAWTHNSFIKMEKNPNYWDADSIKLDKITFALSDDDDAILASYKSGKYNLINSFPQSQIDQLKADYPDEFYSEPQLGTYYISFNVNSTKFSAVANTEAKRASLRRGLAYLLDRKYIVENITKGGQNPANAFVSAGLSDADGSEFVSKNGPEGNGAGYFPIAQNADELAAAAQTGIDLIKAAGYTFDESTKKFTNFPGFTYLINNSSAHSAIAEYVRDRLNNFGITVTIDTQEWSQFLQTRKSGNFDVARNGWVADYDDPSSYLTLWQSNSGNNDCQFGKDAHANEAIYQADLNNNGTIEDSEKNLTWSQSFDVLMNNAAKETNAAKRFQLMHKAENLLMETGAICPIYFYTDMFMMNKGYEGFFRSPLGYKFFMYITKA